MLAAVKNSNCIEDFKKALAANIEKTNPEILWSTKRKFPLKSDVYRESNRFNFTLELTGPGFFEEKYLNIIMKHIGRSSVSDLSELIKLIDGMEVTYIHPNTKRIYINLVENIFPIISLPTDGLMNTGLSPKLSGSWARLFPSKKLMPCEYEDLLYSKDWKDRGHLKMSQFKNT